MTISACEGIRAFPNSFHLEGREGLTVFEGIRAVLNPLYTDDRGELEDRLDNYQEIPGISIFSGSLKVLKGTVETITSIVFGVFSKLAFYVTGQEKFRVYSQLGLTETFHGVRQIIQGFADFICKDLKLTIESVSFGYVSKDWVCSVEESLEKLSNDPFSVDVGTGSRPCYS